MSKINVQQIVAYFSGILILSLCFLTWKSFFQPIEQIRLEYKHKIEKQFHEDISIAKKAVQEGQKSSHKDIIWIKTDLSCKILEWTHAGFFLDSIQFNNLKSQSEKLFFTDENLYYALSQKLENHYFYAFIPIKIEYPVQNKSFKNFYYVGNQTELNPETIIPGDSPESIVIFNDKEAVFSILFAHPESIRNDYKFYWILNFCILLVLVLFICYKNLKIESIILKESIFSIVLLFIRLLFYYFNFPQNFYNTKLFSPEILALSEINPSLGDFSINILILAWICYRWKYILQNYKGSAKNWKPILWYVISVVFSLSVYLSYFAFFNFSSVVFTNSRAFFDFTDIFDIQLYSLLIVVDLALILTVFALLTKQFLFILFPEEKSKKIQFVLIFLAVGIILSFIEYPYLFDFYLFISLIFCLSGLYLSQKIVESTLQNKKIVAKMIEIFGLAFILNMVVAESFNLSAEARVNQLARQFEMPRDTWLETLFPILKDQWAELIQKGSKNPDKLLQQMVQKLNENLKMYPFAMSFVSKKGKVLASYQRETQLVPLENPLPTGISGLWTQPEASSPLGWTYLAEFKHRYKIQLRIDPKPPYVSSFYEKIMQNTETIPQNFSWAIYNNHNLIVQQSSEPFPSKILDFESIKLKTTDQFYVKKLSQNRVLLVRVPNRNLFSRLTSYSFLVYIFSVLFLLVYLPESLNQIHFQSITTRIQMGFLIAAFAPMLLLWLFTQPFLKSYFLEDAQMRLRQDLEQIAAYLTREGIFNQNNEMVWNKNIGNDLLHTLSQILTTDINVYDSTGTLIISTLPSVLPGTISSPLMNYEAFVHLKNQTQSHVIVEEHIGQSQYFSGYIPILQTNKKISAYIHIPYLTRKDVLDTQQRSFTAYLFNLYLILLLIIAAAGFFISRSSMRPLELLREKLGKIGFGKENDKIDWNTKDEIGKLIQSYNALIDLLTESERKLAQNEREFAWREMAKQVAHEIKNPLTPMKLNIQHLIRVTADSENAEKIAKVGLSLLKQIDTLTDIANSFSNFAKMPEGQFQPLSANDLLTDVFRLYEQSEEAEISLINSESQIYILADKDQLSRVLINLVKNALQALTNHGKIELKIIENQGFAIFSVHDNGSGIPPEIQERIFEPNFSTKNSGMGLGLAMSKNIVQNHQGEIYFETFENQGTTFFVKIPILQMKPNNLKE